MIRKSLEAWKLEKKTLLTKINKFWGTKNWKVLAMHISIEPDLFSK